MHMILDKHLIVLAALLTAMPAALAQGDGLRLLPASHLKAIQFKWTQDGRVINLDVGSPSGDTVIPELSILAEYKPCKTLLTIHKIDDPPCPVSPVRHKLKVEIQPGLAIKSVIELKSKGELVSLEVEDARGRPQSAFERLKTKVR